MSALDGEVQIPKLGGVSKKTLMIVGGSAAAFIGWRYWQARGTQSYSGDTTASTDPGYEDPGTLPSVSGAVSGDNSYGYGSSDSTTAVDTYGFNGTTNAQWSQYAVTQLVSSDVWSYTDIVTALGNFLNGKSLTSSQQSIVQAAIAVAGNPPQGSHPIISGGDTAITVAPTGLKVVSTTATQATLSWNTVAGAVGYRLYRSGVSEVAGVANGTSGSIGGLDPNKTYTFQVAAFTASGQIGPKSSSVSGHTKSVTLAKPTGVKASSVTRSSFVMTCSPVSGATNYRWYLNNSLKGSTDAPQFTFSGLKANTRYAVIVKADVSTQSPGPNSATVYVTTKK